MRNFNEGQVNYNDFGKSEQGRSIEFVFVLMCEIEGETLKLPAAIPALQNH